MANGHRVLNIGQQAVQFATDDGPAANIWFQIAEIERPLISASALAASGNSVVFNQKRMYDHPREKRQTYHPPQARRHLCAAHVGPGKP